MTTEKYSPNSSQQPLAFTQVVNDGDVRGREVETTPQNVTVIAIEKYDVF